MNTRKWFSILMFTIFVLGAFGVSDIQAGPVDTPPIRLQAGTFNPGQGEALDLPPSLESVEDRTDQPSYYIVQFRGPVQQAWIDQVRAVGAELLSYIPDYAFKVRMDGFQAEALRALDQVIWVGAFQPAYKLSPDLDMAGMNLVRVRIESGADLELVRTQIAQPGVQVLGGEGEFVLAAADGAGLGAIARVPDVAWVEPFNFPEKHNEYGAGVIVGANTANANGYDGSTQIAAVADSGLGGGTATTAHLDIPASRITALHNFVAPDAPGCYTVIHDGVQDVDSGHGTHTAASVVSDGGPGGEGKGAAPAASLVFQAIEDYVDFQGFCAILYADGYLLIGIPGDLGDLFQPAYDAGERVHSNSWGAPEYGAYTANSVETDTFIWNHQDMTITFSSGNAGTDGNSDGVVDSDSIGSPATAKNVITVGASEGDRAGNYQCDGGLLYDSHDSFQAGQSCEDMGGNQAGFLGTYGGLWPGDFPTNPLNSDVLAGNAEQMAAFSSRGPTDDGRIKPDVVAPGTWILSGYSMQYQEGYGDPVNPQNSAYQYDGWGMPLNVDYKYMGGTSMANPITAGAATVVRDFYEKTDTHSASAALVKATLINSAVDILDENNDGADDNDFPIPNDHEGWGRVNLVGATDTDREYVDETSGLSTAGSASYEYDLNAGSPFKVTLVWSDYPSTEAAAANLVNNLDLVVTAPGGAQTYLGNVFSGGWSQTGGSADDVNNVENVFVQTAGAGVWTVQVSGANVPNGPQPYALVVEGDIKIPTAVTLADFSAERTVGGIMIAWQTLLEVDLLGFNVQRSTGAGWEQINPELIPSQSPGGPMAAGEYAYLDLAPPPGETYFYRLEAVGTDGNTYFGPVSAEAWYDLFVPLVIR